MNGGCIGQGGYVIYKSTVEIGMGNSHALHFQCNHGIAVNIYTYKIYKTYIYNI